MNRWLPALLCLALWPTASLAEAMTPGLWTLVMAVEQSGRTEALPEVTQCILQGDIDDGNRVLPRPQGACTLSNVQRSADGATYDLACINGSLQSRGKAQLRFAGERYDGAVTMAMSEKGAPAQTFTMRIDARRIGACPAGK